MRPITVLYEDSYDDGATTFGPHELVRNCVAQMKSLPPHALKDALVGHPKKGNGNVLETRALTRIAKKRHVVAVLDADKVRRLANVGSDACKTKIIEALRSRLPEGTPVTIVLLEQNLESLLDCLDGQPGLNADELQRAKQKDRTARDLIFNKVAHDHALAPARQAIMANQSFRYLVAKIASL